MIIPQDLLTALPFWDIKEKQTFRQHFCNGAEEAGAIQCRHDRHLPWIIKNQGSAPTYVYLVASNGLTAIDITSRLTLANITVDSVDFCYHEGAVDVSNMDSDNNEYLWNGSTWGLLGDKSYNNFVQPCGLYYYEISFGGTLYFSELMQIATFAELSDSTDIESNRCRIEAVSTCSISEIPPIISQKLFIKSPAADPEYQTTKDVAEDGNDDTIDLWVKMVKRYRVTFFGIETIADFVASLPLYNTINFTDQYGFQGPIKDLTYQIQWPEDKDGCLALIEVSFIREYIAQTGCC